MYPMEFIAPQNNYSESEALVRERSAGSARHADKPSAPHIVIRGETIINTPYTIKESPSYPLAFIDYLSFSHRSNLPFDEHSTLVHALINIFNIPTSDWDRSEKGWNGYEKKIDMGKFGLIAWGGHSQKGTIHVQITGKGCALITDWQGAHDWLKENKCKITRVDIAHDDFEGKEISVEKSLQWFDQGLFNTNGRPPSRRLIDDFGSGSGKTFYVGKRQNGKMARIYEKGKEQGDKNSPWCRAEVEFRSKGRKIEYDALLKPHEYFSGAYECFEFLSTEQSRIKTFTQEKIIKFEAAVIWGRSACGKLINLLCKKENNDYEKVINILRRDGYPKQLEEYAFSIIDDGSDY